MYSKKHDKSPFSAMVDPDAPSRKNPRAAQWLHWILTNVQGEKIQSKQKKYNQLPPPSRTTTLSRDWWFSSRSARLFNGRWDEDALGVGSKHSGTRSACIWRPFPAKRVRNIATPTIYWFRWLKLYFMKCQNLIIHCFRSGPHRYVLLVWQQQQNVSMESPGSRWF